MNESSIIKPVLKLILAFLIMGSMAACGSANTASPTSDPISSIISSFSPLPTSVPKPELEPSTTQAASDNTIPKESAAKEDAIQASTQPISSPAQESASTAPAIPSSTPLAPLPKGVTLSITGDDKHGVILSSTIVDIEGEVNVMTLLQKETRKEKIQMESSGKGIFAYVKGIANLYEFDRGAKSGWLFKVNGVFADKGAGSVKVKAGDQVEWLYTLDLGKDIGVKR